MKKFLITSSTLESAFKVFQRSMFSGLPNALPANNKLLCRIGHSASYIASGFNGQRFLSFIYGVMYSIARAIPRPSGSEKVQRLSSGVDKIWAIVVIASRLKSE